VRVSSFKPAHFTGCLLRSAIYIIAVIGCHKQAYNQLTATVIRVCVCVCGSTMNLSKAEVDPRSIEQPQ
jgi:hypothetical protein